jgi:2'-5' RNA ligase
MEKRLFIAFKLHPDASFLKAFKALQQEMGRHRIKWVEEHNIHLTMKFLGATPEEKIPLIGHAMQSACLNAAAPLAETDTLSCFGSRYQPRVLQLPLKERGDFTALFQRLMKELAAAGFEGDRQNFVPHLTLGRINGIADLKAFQQSVGKYCSAFVLSETCQTLILYESVLSRSGPVYTALESVTLTP